MLSPISAAFRFRFRNPKSTMLLRIRKLASLQCILTSPSTEFLTLSLLSGKTVNSENPLRLKHLLFTRETSVMVMAQSCFSILGLNKGCEFRSNKRVCCLNTFFNLKHERTDIAVTLSIIRHGEFFSLICWESVKMCQTIGDQLIIAP